MAAEITRECETCGGDGVVTVTGEGGSQSGVPCWQCGESGSVAVSTLDDSDILTACSDILEKCNDILGKCNEILTEIQGGS